MNKAYLLFFFAFLFGSTQLSAEGSVDFINYPGHRLFLRSDKDQQMKVYAKAGEFINVGSSHTGFDGGVISVYRPDGTLHTVFDGSDGSTGIIFNNIEELNGPTGAANNGYTPGVVQVTAATEGIWSVIYSVPDFTGAAFENLLNNEPWTRENDQPTNRRVITSWDITVSENAAGPNGGNLLTGRVYANEYNSMINMNGTTTSPRFFVLTPDGLLYTVDFMETDPWGFPLSSSSLGLLNSDQSPTYQSWPETVIERSADPTTWQDGTIYQYEPQAEDYENLINNKIFFNIPDATMPMTALVTDIFRNNTHVTWLFTEPFVFEIIFNDFTLNSTDENGETCNVEGLQYNQGAYFIFDTSVPGNVALELDINDDGDLDDPEDLTVYGYVAGGIDSLYWNGADGLGNPIPVQENYNFGFQFFLRGGENHIQLSDVENNTGGVVFELISDVGAIQTDIFYYDHTPVGGPVSGGGTPGNPLPTTTPFIYDEQFGNQKALDYWAYVVYGDTGGGNVTIDIVEDCTDYSAPDTDGDGITDDIDLDDDNDGIPDYLEYCTTNDFSCLPGGFDPAGNEDDDEYLNYQDADDVNFTNPCIDLNADGICDFAASVYDQDNDGVINSLDLDSDNDGITDLFEANHGQSDLDLNGIIDGNNLLFGDNGFFNVLATDPNADDAVANYSPSDKDNDEVLDAYDLDSDNDGIYDVAEAGEDYPDEDNDGRLNISPVSVDTFGLAVSLNGIVASSIVINPRDKDGDGVHDFRDLDSDNDTFLDVGENHGLDSDNDGRIGINPITVNADGVAIAAGVGLLSTSSLVDKDGDGIPNFHDLDSDNDGINDIAEYWITSFNDADNDGIGGYGLITVDEDGVLTTDPAGNPINSGSNPVDTDEDNLANIWDLDSDNDGINDVEEGGHGDDDNDGIVGTGNPFVNIDGQATDGIQGAVISTSNLIDTDGDNYPDYLDLDADNDGINDVIEAGNDDPDNDGIVGTANPTVNADGQANMVTSNPIDTDGDGFPDYQDLDSDNDAINDVEEGGNEDPDNDGIIGTGIPIVNENGQAPGSNSNPTDTDEDGMPDYLDLDSDGDNISDVVEGGNLDPDNDGIIGTGIPDVNENGQADGNTSNPPDTDMDGDPDYQDIDADGDGIVDIYECPDDNTCVDNDEDGIPDFLDPDSDGDGINDIDECETGADCVDTDNDGIPDYIDLDTDNDGILDEDECVDGAPCPDTDLDGIPDWRDPACEISIEAVTGGGIYCEGENISLGATTNVNGEVVDFVWTNMITGDTFPGTTANDPGMTLVFLNANASHSGNYILSITTPIDDCTTSSAAVSVNVAMIPEAPILTTDNATVCAGSTAVLNTNPNGGVGMTYQWFNGDLQVAETVEPSLTIENFSAIDAGTYTVIAFNEDCPSAVSNAIEITFVDMEDNIVAINTTNAENPACNGTEVTLTVPEFDDATVEWFGPENTSLGDTFNLTLTDVTEENEGEYYAVLTFEACGEMTSSTTEVFVQSNNIVPELNADNDEICAGQSIILNVINELGIESNDTVIYTWYNAAGEQVAQTTEGNYNFENVDIEGDLSVVVSINGCEGPSGNYYVTVLEIPNETANIPENLIYFCADEAFELQAVDILESEGMWSSLGTATILDPSNNITQVDNLVEGENVFVWTLSVELCGEFSTDTVTVFAPANIEAFDDIAIVEQNEILENMDASENDVITDSNGVTYSIVTEPQNGTASMTNVGVYSYTPSEDYEGEDEFIYSVCSNECPDDCVTASVLITVNNTVYIDDCFVPNGITPNDDGANDALEIPCLDNDNFPNNNIAIFNRWGDKVYEKTGYDNDWLGTYNGKQLPSGTYFYILEIEPGNTPLQGFFTIVY